KVNIVVRCRVDAKGKVTIDKFSKEIEDCLVCAIAAKGLIENMPLWEPAMTDENIKCKSSTTLPIAFDFTLK
ncbi:MAG: hypothetical protein ABIV51_05650, partial [Saprospiraceae bacterium]